MGAVTWRWPRRCGTALLAGTALLLAGTASAAATDSSSGSTAMEVDSLWNQPQGTRVDSAFYIVQTWWDGLTRVSQRDPHQRGLQELAQANEDLLNAYTLLQEQRNDPGPHPVPVIDPLLSGAYGVITGVQLKAPIGSVFTWLNQAALHVEGRGSTETIIQSLVSDYATQQARAARDLGPMMDGALRAVLSENAIREAAMTAKIKGVAPTTLALAWGSPTLTPAGTVAQPSGTASRGATATVASNPGARAKDTGGDHGKDGDSHGKGGDGQKGADHKSSKP